MQIIDISYCYDKDYQQIPTQIREAFMNVYAIV